MANESSTMINSVPETPIYTNIPPIQLSFNEYGLRTNINYIFTQDGRVDWRKMLKPEHLAPDKNKTTETDISKLDDSKLIILKSGILYLAWLRGYVAVNYITHPSNNYVCAQCNIAWMPNFETNFQTIAYESVADASKENTNEGIASLYLAAIAENRAFARAVRTFLNINVVAEEEIKQNSNISSPGISDEPVALFKELMTTSGFTFTKIKKLMIKEGKEGAENWNNENDIAKPILFEIIGRLKKKIDSKNEKNDNNN